MRDILERVADGTLTPAQAEAELRGHARNDAGRFDAAREGRTGIPEAVLAEGKTARETATMVATSVETTGHALATRVVREQAEVVEEHLADEHPEASLEYDDRARTLVAHAPDYEPPELAATVGVVTAGTSDAIPAGEAAVTAGEMGATIERVDDVGVAGIHRLFDSLDGIREADVLVVAAGREGALPTVLAGLVDAPLIALPVSTGYGHGGEGQAALDGMLQSCTPLTVVNIDAGFTAGAQAGLVARAVSAARTGE
ncbi:nickel pincer cofactor biosynthesis protein LarB [Natronomonas sp. EA1]|uniref:nickel pincer cofactor biosynthesis protein LarB n=1 Tax=Natronomonas sp. EA1 TaxID=3421655 RepID=UPI003EBD70E0